MKHPAPPDSASPLATSPGPAAGVAAGNPSGSPNGARELLDAVAEGRLSVDAALQALAATPAESPPTLDLGHTRLDLERGARCGFGEVIYGAGKTPTELVEIARAQLARGPQLLATRLQPEGAAALADALPQVTVHAQARVATAGLPADGQGVGRVLVVSAGTSDGPVAEEAALTARMLGARVERVSDVGVAGLHRLLEERERLERARVLVVVAGMEGALPSVVGGLVSAPVLAVPTSVGYGASFCGLSALLGMLNSCAAGVLVVNIDNGFGAGYAAARINALEPLEPTP